MWDVAYRGIVRHLPFPTVLTSNHLDSDVETWQATYAALPEDGRSDQVCSE